MLDTSQPIWSLAVLGAVVAGWYALRLALFAGDSCCGGRCCFGSSRFWRGYRGEWALVTGAASGIGLGFARALARRKINVILVDRDPSVEATAQSLATQHGVQTKGIIFDVLQGLEGFAFMEQKLAQFAVRSETMSYLRLEC